MAGGELGRLCRGGGWTYGALWCNDCRDPRLLVLKESYHEEQSGKIFEELVNEVHVIGEGTIGEAAISGKHRWINLDTICMDSSEISTSVNPQILQASAEWQDQILAGVKTIAVIPLPTLGVLQFGSIQKIRESSEFIAQARHFLWQFRIKQHGYPHVDMNLCHPQATLDSVISSMDYSRFRNNVSLYDSICKQRQDNHLSSKYSSLASGLLSLGSQTGTRSRQTFSMPLSTSSGPFDGQGYLFYGTPASSGTSYQVINQQAASTKARFLPQPINSELRTDLNCSSNLFPTSFLSNMQAKDIDSSYYMENKLLQPMAIPKSLNTIPISLNSSNSQSDAFHSPSKNSVSSTSIVENRLSVCDNLSTSKSSSKVFPFTLDLPEIFLTSPQDRNPENSTLIHSNTKTTNQQIHNNFMNNPIHSCEQTNDQLNNGLSIPSGYNFPDVPIASSSMNQLITDNDLFHGMELDLSPMISRQECWDDMVLPVVGNGCTDFSAGVSDFISELEMGSVAGYGKGLFSDSSSCEQLLDAVVTGNAIVSSSCNSVDTTNSVICQESRHHISTIMKHSDAHKMMQGSPSDAQTNSHVPTWIDDSCSVNAEGSALHQQKKLEESAKVVRKRAKPGESTRPRPKDRQQIQDRVKELREIVPNGTKCSIDSLLDRTIKHMLFLQSVSKYVDKLKQADLPELIGEESGVVLKDNTNEGVGGATWAYEVARQTMVCPILVEDVHPSGQMLVEMLCEERGFFLEIADVVRGFGLTILKGDMEIRERKVWARFLVEVIERILPFTILDPPSQCRNMISLLLQANRNVTRMDIFLSLVQFLQQTSSFQASELNTRAISSGINALTACQQQSPAPIPIGLAGKLH